MQSRSCLSCLETASLPKAHLNAYVPPASTDWSAHEWREGDFVRHFAGCPWQDVGSVGSVEAGSLVRRLLGRWAVGGGPPTPTTPITDHDHHHCDSTKTTTTKTTTIPRPPRQTSNVKAHNDSWHV